MINQKQTQEKKKGTAVRNIAGSRYPRLNTKIRSHF